MTAPPLELVALAVLLFGNRLLVPAYALNTPVYAAVQLVNVVAAAWVALRGLPGLDRFPVVGWMVAALLVFHVAQNASIRGRKQHDLEMRASEKELARKRAELRGTLRDDPLVPPADPELP